MFFNSHVNTFGRILCVVGLSAFLNQSSFSETPSLSKTLLAQAPNNITFDELDETETNKAEESPGDEAAEPAPEIGELAEPQAKKPRAKRSPLPTVDELIEAKLSALRAKQAEQEKALAIAEQKLQQEVEIEKRTFDNNAYLSLSIKNTAPPQDYKLEKTDIYVDGKRIVRGGPRNNGLPRNSEFFFGPVEPGCHDIRVEAKYIRLKNDLISRFKVDRVVHASKVLGFVAKNGYRVEINIEGFEQQNSIVNWFRGPAVRFNRSVRPNFLPGATIVSMDDVLKQGRLHIDYLTEDSTHHQLMEKSLSIDGLPILVAEKHDAASEKSVVFDAPLAEGKHTLNVVLLFKEKKWVQGGANYNFRLTFDRDFYVISGQTTFINLTGMPHDGFRRSPHETRYARAVSVIKSQEYPDMFSDMTCKEQRDKKIAEEQKKIREDAKIKVKGQQQPAPAPEVQGEEAIPLKDGDEPAKPAPAPKADETAPEKIKEEEEPKTNGEGVEPGILPVPLEVPLQSPPVIRPDESTNRPGANLEENGGEPQNPGEGEASEKLSDSAEIKTENAKVLTTPAGG